MAKVPEFRLIAEPLTAEAKEAQGFRWAKPEIGTRHKIGGEPEFIQNAVTPDCRSCHKEMVFYGQLDSLGDRLALADCGIVYVFVCFDCFEANAFIQSN